MFWRASISRSRGARKSATVRSPGRLTVRLIGPAGCREAIGDLLIFAQKLVEQIVDRVDPCAGRRTHSGDERIEALLEYGELFDAHHRKVGIGGVEELARYLEAPNPEPKELEVLGTGKIFAVVEDLVERSGEEDSDVAEVHTDIAVE